MRVLSAVVIALAVAAPALPASEEDELLLRSRRIAVDAAGLLDYLRTILPKEPTQAEIDRAVAELGHDSYRCREAATFRLIDFGPPAVATLRRAQASDDLEVKHRAERCLTAIQQQHDPEVLAAAVRVIEARALTGAQQLLIELLPYVKNESLEDNMRRALVGLVERQPGSVGKLMPYLADKEPLRRGAAALVLGRFGNDNERRSVRQLFHDVEPLVRLRAAEGVMAALDPAAIPVYIELLKEPALASVARDYLELVAGAESPDTSGMNTAQAQFAWRKWWEGSAQDKGLAARLAAAIDLDERCYRLANQLAAAFEQGDIKTLEEITDCPFQMGDQRMADRPELEKQLNMAVGFIKQAQLKLNFRAERRSLPFPPGQQPWKEGMLRLVRFEFRPETPQEKGQPGQKTEKGVVVIRFHAGQARVVGINGK